MLAYQTAVAMTTIFGSQEMFNRLLPSCLPNGWTISEPVCGS